MWLFHVVHVHYVARIQYMQLYKISVHNAQSPPLSLLSCILCNIVVPHCPYDSIKGSYNDLQGIQMLTLTVTKKKCDKSANFF